MIILFADNDRSQKADETGFNKIGYITESKEVIFLWRKRVVRRGLSNLQKFPHKYLSPPKSLDRNNVEKFFLENLLTLELFNLGLRAMLQNDIAYFSHPIKLPRLEPINKDYRKEQWLVLKSVASKADLLFTFDTKSLVSKVISMVDRGPWSHCAMYTGKGTIIEVIASGVSERPLEVYADSKYRVGLYRYRLKFCPEKLIQGARSRIGEGYSYKKAAIAGLRILTGNLNRGRATITV